MRLGIFSFVENTPNAETGIRLHSPERLKRLLEEIELADQARLDLFGIGKHDHKEYFSSAQSVILAAAAERTKQIRLTSAVTLLGSEDTVRVFQQFSTIGQLFE